MKSVKLFKKSKKAQAVKMIVYLLTMVIVVFVLIFGYRAIKKLTEQTESASTVKFKNELKRVVDVGASYGRVSTQDLSLMTDYRQVCLIGVFALDVKTGPTTISNGLVLDSVETGSPNNAFLVREDAIEGFEIGPMMIDSMASKDGMCVNITNGKISLRLVGGGDLTEIYEARPKG